MLWNDRRGRFSPLRAGTLAALLTPFLYLVYLTVSGGLMAAAVANPVEGLGPRPVNEAIHFVGLWSIRFLVATLAVTPLRRMARYAKLVDVRRMIGVACFLYIALHFTLYIVDQSYDLAKVASEIVLRIYLTIGFVAWLGLFALALTSNDYMTRKLGGVRWRKLHQLTYVITTLAVIHYFMQSKLNVFEPTVLGGIFAWMMLYRIAHWTLPRSFLREDGELPLWFLGALAIATAFLVMLFESFGLGLSLGVDPWLILSANFTFDAGIRPGWYVLMFGAAIFLVALVRLRPAPRAA